MGEIEGNFAKFRVQFMALFLVKKILLYFQQFWLFYTLINVLTHFR